MSTRKHKSVKVVWRKLGKERAWGQATIGENLIEIDPRLGAKRQLEVLCHEQVHLTFPGMTEAEAATALATAKLTLGTITQANSSTVAAGMVIESDPVLNSDVAEGTVVNLIISNGKVMVPDVRNLGISEARDIMSAAEVGFTVSITTREVCTGTPGTIVVDQSILPGLADQRSAIVLYVACNVG